MTPWPPSSSSAGGSNTSTHGGARGAYHPLQLRALPSPRRRRGVWIANGWQAPGTPLHSTARDERRSPCGKTRAAAGRLHSPS
eukprot:1844973-Lingulodinium_polyedra.AAC.2